MDTLTLGAFARSGNHYFQHLVDTALIDVKCDWLSHRMSDWDDKPNRVTIMRDPLDCVTSWISTTQDNREDRAEKVLEWYISYHEKIRSLNQIVILGFDELITDPLGSINKVCNIYGLPKSFFSSNETLTTALESPFDYIWANLPNVDLSGIKKEVQNSPYFSSAMSLFGELHVPVGVK